MERISWFEFRGHLRQCVNGVVTRCKACDAIIRFDLETKQELRHRCGVEDHPEAPGGDSGASEASSPEGDDASWDDLDEVEDPLSLGDRFAMAEDIGGYGDDLQEITSFTRGEYDPGY